MNSWLYEYTGMHFSRLWAVSQRLPTGELRIVHNFISPLFVLHTYEYIHLICTYMIIKTPLKFGGCVKKSTTVKEFMLSYWNEQSRKWINIGENPYSLRTCVLLSCTLAFAEAKKKFIKYKKNCDILNSTYQDGYK